MNPNPSANLAPSADGLWHSLRFAPGAFAEGEGSAAADALAVVGGVIRWVGARSAVPPEHAGLPAFDGTDALVTPGLVDCHTHLVYGGQRANEFAMRLAGARDRKSVV